MRLVLLYLISPIPTCSLGFFKYPGLFPLCEVVDDEVLERKSTC